MSEEKLYSPRALLHSLRIACCIWWTFKLHVACSVKLIEASCTKNLCMSCAIALACNTLLFLLIYNWIRKQVAQEDLYLYYLLLTKIISLRKVIYPISSFKNNEKFDQIIKRSILNLHFKSCVLWIMPSSRFVKDWIILVIRLISIDKKETMKRMWHLLLRTFTLEFISVQRPLIFYQ